MPTLLMHLVGRIKISPNPLFYSKIKMNVALSLEQIEFVQAKIISGEYQTPEQVVAVALRLLETLQSEAVVERVTELQERIRIGTKQIQQKQVQDGEDVFNRLQQRLVEEYSLGE